MEEITPLSEKDCFHVVDRHKSEFTYPLHQHREYELNFVENAAGVKRIVGDSVEVIGNYDLVLICSENLEHVWDNGDCTSHDIREVTIQFSPDLLSGSLMSKNQFGSIVKMFRDADHGLSFSQHTIMKIYSAIDGLAAEPEGFMRFLKFLKILFIFKINRKFINPSIKCSPTHWIIPVMGRISLYSKFKCTCQITIRTT